MANIYVRSTDGSDADNGSTWALAKATLAGAAAIDAAGDSVFVSSSHNENPATAQTWAWAGTLTSPIRVVSADDSAEPPTTYSRGARVSAQNNLTIASTGSVHLHGMVLRCGSGASTAHNLNVQPAGAARISLIDCELRTDTTNLTSIVQIGSNNSSVELVDTDFRFSNTSHRIEFGSGVIRWDGGAMLSGSSSPATLFAAAPVGTQISISGLDLTNAGTSMNLFNTTTRQVTVVCRNFKLPSGWAGSFFSGTPGIGSVFSFYNCDSGDTNYKLAVYQYAGTVLDETTIVRTGGASDGTTPIAWRMVSNSNARFGLCPLESPEIVRWNETTGSSVTVTVEVVTDGVTLKDDQCWLEVQYLGTSGYPLGTFISDAKADVLATAANQATSTETWTTTGLTTPVKQKLSVSFTPQEKGFIHAVVKLAKASTTVYVDPVLTVT